MAKVSILLLSFLLIAACAERSVHPVRPDVLYRNYIPVNDLVIVCEDTVTIEAPATVRQSENKIFYSYEKGVYSAWAEDDKGVFFKPPEGIYNAQKGKKGVPDRSWREDGGIYYEYSTEKLYYWANSEGGKKPLVIERRYLYPNPYKFLLLNRAQLNSPRAIWTPLPVFISKSGLKE